MTIKQTQTKMFDFSDVGLDFCSGSKTLFPDRFKKMLALGYNTQTVTSAVVAGNQVVLTYGVSHGYVADRVLQINGSNLLGEYVVDSVTSNTVTFTVDNAPMTISGGFTTFVAPLGMQLVYEQSNIHVYKFKDIDESDLFLRLCFQNNASYRNRVSPCVGRSVDLSSGFITDVNALSQTKQVTTPNSAFAWEFSYSIGNTYDAFNYSQGLSLFGKGAVVGSVYHLVILSHAWNNPNSTINSVLPSQCFSYDALKLPVLFGYDYGQATSSGSTQPLTYLAVSIGNKFCKLQQGTTANTITYYPVAAASFLPSDIDLFNTTVASPITLFEKVTGQFIGFVAGGMYMTNYGSTNAPTISLSNLPQKTAEIDLSNNCYTHVVNMGNASAGSAVFFTIPIEEIKVGA